MPEGDLGSPALIDPRKFQDPMLTADGDPRAHVALAGLRTLWFNTGTLCNLTCENCYIESSPRNDRLVYITEAEVRAYLDEIAAENIAVEEIGYTGGEPFMNPEFPAMLETSLARGFRTLVLTNAMVPLRHARGALLALKARHGPRLALRVSIDHYTPAKHERLRGPASWGPMVEGVKWLAANGFALTVAGRTCWGEADSATRRGYAGLFRELGIAIDADDPARLVLFPEMSARLDVPEITVACWDILGVRPETMMCASSRMVVKRKGAKTPVVAPCTLLPYDPGFEMGRKLVESLGEIRLNHPHCARFCVLGGGACSPN